MCDIAPRRHDAAHFGESRGINGRILAREDDIRALALFERTGVAGYPEYLGVAEGGDAERLFRAETADLCKIDDLAPHAVLRAEGAGRYHHRAGGK